MKRGKGYTDAGRAQIGALSPRYAFAVNPYSDVRFTACSKCRSITRARKLVLAIHVDAFGMIILRKTCRLCTVCEMVIVHRDELEPLIADKLHSQGHSIHQPDYLVLGTVDSRLWRRGMTESLSLDEVVRGMADFQKHLTIEQTDHGWGPSR